MKAKFDGLTISGPSARSAYTATELLAEADRAATSGRVTSYAIDVAANGNVRLRVVIDNRQTIFVSI